MRLVFTQKSSERRKSAVVLFWFGGCVYFGAFMIEWVHWQSQKKSTIFDCWLPKILDEYTKTYTHTQSHTPRNDTRNTWHATHSTWSVRKIHIFVANLKVNGNVESVAHRLRSRIVVCLSCLVVRRAVSRPKVHRLLYSLCVFHGTINTWQIAQHSV